MNCGVCNKQIEHLEIMTLHVGNKIACLSCFQKQCDKILKTKEKDNEN